MDVYHTILENIRKNQPKMDYPENFSGQVIQKIRQQESSHRLKIHLVEPMGTWKLFIGFRNAMAVAAIFLVGFFIYQQWEIMSKVSRLEMEIQNQKEASITQDNLEITKTHRVKQLLEQRLITETSLQKSLNGNETVVIKKSVLNNLFETMDQLEKENRHLRSLLKIQNNDSIKTLRNYKSKTL